MAESGLDHTGVIVCVNAALIAVALIGAGWWFARRPLSVTEPDARQNAGEAVLDFFVGKARGIATGPRRDRLLVTITAFLSTLFLFILFANATVLFPVPVLNRPPTAHFSVTLTLALIAVVGTLVITGIARGARKAALHLVWPNPLQWVSEVTDVISLSLRLFGNIAGEYMTLVLVVAVVPIGIPLILHTVGLIPTFVQAFVFTLLTASFLATAIAHESPDRSKRQSSTVDDRPAVDTDAAQYREGVSA